MSFYHMLRWTVMLKKKKKLKKKKQKYTGMYKKKITNLGWAIQAIVFK